MRCLVVGQLPPPDLNLIQGLVSQDQAELVLAEPEQELGPLGDFEVIWRLFPAGAEPGFQDQLQEALDCHPEVRWVHSASAGIDRLAHLFRDRAGTILTHSAGVTAIPIAEFVVGCLLEHCKRFPELQELQRQRRFGRLDLRELADLRVVLFGMGAISRQLVTRLVPFGCYIVGVRKDLSRSTPPGVSIVFAAEDLARACRHADALVLVAPLTSETRGAVDATVLAEMEPGSVLVNVARGGLVDELALLRALAAGRPATAYLDAFSEEPLPASSPLWTSSGVRVSPHISWNSPHLARRTSQLFAEQLRRWLAGEELLNRADPGAGY